MKNYTKLITSLAALVAVVGIWGGLLAACASESSTASSTPTQTTVTPSPNVLPSETTDTEETAVTEYRDPADVSELPLEVQVYTSMAADLVDAGTLPSSAVTISAVQADVAREYGITLTAAEADTVVQAILR
ncbi:hypothetical protein PBI_MAHDIA_40 [Gordonia phage Mahdia]|uniref:Lipoprotein n=1 Tax=Gordonia phage Mahdia TaxID=2047873 RepID=A0A2H4PAD0_9CAUD|nr:hypothetical protein FDJ14_gp40 [Gordonia phage Mahdia]ATW59039.1 hypothetical protein PBI_MAHDIA_40 [Gordonia phage Mahdia]